ncbi:MAG: Do family serine endopeptidase [Phycisphaerae bacterium]|nr:Do family serine endopeptidase [Phycisphaerae bacterium]
MNLTKQNVSTMLAILIVMSSLCGSALATDVDTNGIETLRKTSKAFSGVAKQATPAVVAVQVRTKIEAQSMGFGPGSPFDEDFFERFFGRPMPRGQQRQQPRYQEGQASGFVISADGYILTNNHVVEDADEITVVMGDGQEYEKVKLVGTDDKADVALLKIENVDDLPYLELGNSDELEMGEWVIAIGNPFGLTETLTVGVVSALGRKLGRPDVYQDFIQTDAAINPGNSGGPLLNLEGKVVGINSAIITGDRGYMGIGLAVPINVAKAIKEQLIATGKVHRGYLGVLPQDIEPEMVDLFKLKDNKGAIIINVEEDSPADKAGLEKDDVIIKIGDKKVEDGQDVRNIVSFIVPETEVEFTIVRNGKEKKLTVKIGSRQESNLAETSDLGKKFGLTVATIDEEVADQYNVEEGKGVVVVEVKSGSPAARAGIRKGMVILEVNRTEVNTVGEFNEAIAESEDSKKALLLVKTGRYAQYVVLVLRD